MNNIMLYAFFPQQPRLSILSIVQPCSALFIDSAELYHQRCRENRLFVLIGNLC